ncbi:hypothetical protein HDV00_007432 [Rhizophlyctis rosea]|nr:hypothetical protein HDV00_007432 [Rhizophlyctis rosea]
MDPHQRQTFQKTYTHLTSGDPTQAWTSGQWMTERSGGSDVRNTETLATLLTEEECTGVDAEGTPLGPWRVDGFKWFSSATDGDVAVLLAKIPSFEGKGGELTAFLAPMRRRVVGGGDSILDTEQRTELNGIQISRLKQKLGTRPLPTAELGLTNTRAHIIGEPGRGTKEISTVLNITRIYTAVTALGYWGRALGVVRAYAGVRAISGMDGERRLLSDVPLFVRGVAREVVRYRAAMGVGFLCVALLGVEECGGCGDGDRTRLIPTDPRHVSILLRILTPISKVLCSSTALAGLISCTQCLGGLGYIENGDAVLNVARLVRDCAVLCIWEGTCTILAGDLQRALMGREGEAWSVLDGWVRGVVEGWGGVPALDGVGERVVERWEGVMHRFRGMGKQEGVYWGEEVLKEIGWVVAAVVLGKDARRDGCALAGEVVRRWVFGEGWEGGGEGGGGEWREEAKWDKVIVFGEEGGKAKL